MKKYRKVYIEITNICNLNCECCPSTLRKKECLSVENYMKIAGEVAKFTKFVYFHLMGEPLIHPNLKELLDISEDNNLSVNITTNGTLIDKNVEMLMNSNAVRKVSFSLHSYEANQMRMSLREYLKNIFEASSRLSNAGKIVVFKLWNLDSNEIKGQNSMNKKILDSIEDYFNVELNNEYNVQIGEHIYLQLAKKFNWPDITLEEKNKKVFCYGLRDQFGILVDGTVVPCCLDNDGNINLGNIHKDGLENILNSDKARDIFINLGNGKPICDLCKRCDYAIRRQKR